MNILQDIFQDHYEEMLYILHPRQTVIENVDRMINCGDPSYGGECMAVPNVAISSLSLFAAIAVSVLPAATCIPPVAPPLCLSN